MSLRVGLTGGIGSGKTTVAGLLEKRGAAIVDTDAIARGLTSPGGTAVAEIVRQFGTPFLGSDGGVDRARLRQVVFADVALRHRLEAILHPLIGREALRQGAEAPADRPVVFDIPLLAESVHWRQRLDRVLVIDCSAARQKSRVQGRSGWTTTEIEGVMAQQCSRAQRRAVADAVIVNEEDDLAALARELDSLSSMGFWRQP